MYCTKCGSVVPEGAVFCRTCGNAVTPASPAMPAESAVAAGSLDPGAVAPPPIVAPAARVLCAASAQSVADGALCRVLAARRSIPDR